MVLENDQSPLGFLEELERARKRGETDLVEAIERSKTGRDLLHSEKLSQFRGSALSEEALLFKKKSRRDWWDGLVGRRSHKGLAVVFTGKKQRPMMPLPSFLQRINADQWDVLVLRDRRQMHYRMGCQEFASDFQTLAHHIMEIGKNFDRVVSIGTSMGGLAAVRLALIGGAQRAVSIGGRRPWDAHRVKEDKSNPPAFDPICACLPRAQRDVLLVHAEGCLPDVQEAQFAAEVCGGCSFPVSGLNNHGVMKHLWEQGLLGDFLSIAMDINVPAGDAVDLFHQGNCQKKPD